MEKLSKNELLKLRKQIQRQLDGLELSSESVLLYDAIKTVLWNRYKITVPELGIYNIKSQSLKKLLKDIVLYLEDIGTTYNLSDDKRDKVNLYYLFVETVTGYLKRCNIPLTPKSILVNWDIFLGELDNNFPGYLSAGAINLILNGGSNE